MPTITETLKTDISHRGDYELAPHGDLGLVSGLDNIKQALFHRLVTYPGTLIHRPNYGVGLKDFQNAPSNLGVQRQLAIRIKEQFELDPRVEEVLGVSVSSEDNTPEKVVIVVRVRIVGYDEVTAKFIPFGGEGVA